MYRKNQKEFKRCIESAMQDGLERLAARIDKFYQKRGIPKRKPGEKPKRGRPSKNTPQP